MIHHRKNQISPIIILEAVASPAVHIWKLYSYCSAVLVSYLPSLTPVIPTNPIYTPFYIVLQEKMNDDSSLIYINDVQN